jgi:tRNA (cmo5U34)-methyltransferase
VARAARTEFRCARFEDLRLPPRSVQLVTSCISLHHVVDKAALYAALFDALEPGGWLVFADQMAGATEHAHGVNWSAWQDFCRAEGNCSAEELQSLLDHARAHDHYTSVPEHLALLAAAGFEELDCVWRNWIWGIVSARRPR